MNCVEYFVWILFFRFSCQKNNTIRSTTIASSLILSLLLEIRLFKAYSFLTAFYTDVFLCYFYCSHRLGLKTYNNCARKASIKGPASNLTWTNEQVLDINVTIAPKRLLHFKTKIVTPLSTLETIGSRVRFAVKDSIETIDWTFTPKHIDKVRMYMW